MKYSALFSISFLAVLAFMAWKSPQNDDWKKKVDTDLFIHAASGESVDFMVQFGEKPDVSYARNFQTKEEKGKYVFQKLQEVADKSQAKVRQLLQNQGITFQAFYLINAIYTQGNLQLIQQLAEREEVKKIITNPDIRLRTPKKETVAQYRDPSDIEWGIGMIGADQVWSMGYNGQGVTVAGEDTGYDWEHPALQAAYRGWNGSAADHNYHWHDAIHEINPLNDTTTINPCGLNSSVPCDDNNHGTHTMGTMIGEDGQNQIGVAPGAKWMACRNMERGWGSPVSYIECFEFFLAPTDLNGENPRPEMAPHVINNSWSCPEVEGCNPGNWSMMDDAVNNLKAAGIVVVVSAGNSGPNCETVSAPAAMLQNSFTIGSTQITDSISGFSSRGAVTVDGSNRMKPNVSAPGSNVRSSIRNGNYSSFSGTSMAGPHVAGTVALMISANPLLAGQVEVIESILESTAVARTTNQECNGTPGSAVPNNTYGFGRIDAVRAVEAALLVTSDQNLISTKNKVSVAPNPFEQQVNLTFEGMEGPAQLRLFNAAGQEIINQSLQLSNKQVETLNLAGFPGGLYFYRVDFQGEGFSGKLFKQ